MIWQDEARGIHPWKPCRLRWVGKGALPPGVTLYFGIADLSETDLADCVIDLDDLDVLAAFDRRLALRFGCPEEAVREGMLTSVADPVTHYQGIPIYTHPECAPDVIAPCPEYGGLSAAVLITTPDGDPYTVEQEDEGDG